MRKLIACHTPFAPPAHMKHSPTAGHQLHIHTHVLMLEPHMVRASAANLHTHTHSTSCAQQNSPAHIQHSPTTGHQLRPVGVELQQATAHRLPPLLTSKHPAHALEGSVHEGEGEAGSVRWGPEVNAEVRP